MSTPKAPEPVLCFCATHCGGSGPRCGTADQRAAKQQQRAARAARRAAEVPPTPGPGAACWEYQAGELPIRLSFSVKVF